MKTKVIVLLTLASLFLLSCDPIRIEAEIKLIRPIDTTRINPRKLLTPAVTRDILIKNP